MKPTYFSTAQALRRWFAKNHRNADELLVGFHKTATGTPSVTWPEAVDQALCFGWVDGVRKRVDDERYTIRFTPRRPGSTWSAKNIESVARLQSEKRMMPAGRAACERRTEKKSRTYSYERAEAVALDPKLEKEFRAKHEAWKFFEAQAPSYRRKVVHWVMAAKADEVRLRRLRRLIQAFAAGKRLG